MKMTDGKRTIEIKIQKWNGSGYDPDWSYDYFTAGTLPYDEDTDTYFVEDLDGCIEFANDDSEEGACSKYDPETGEFVRDEDMFVFVEELENHGYLFSVLNGEGGDQGTDFSDYKEAARTARKMRQQGDEDAYIAVIDDGNDRICVAEIRDI